MKKFNRRRAERELVAEITDAVGALEDGYAVEVEVDEHPSVWVRLNINIWNNTIRDGLEASLTLFGKEVQPGEVVASIVNLFKARKKEATWTPPF